MKFLENVTFYEPEEIDSIKKTTGKGELNLEQWEFIHNTCLTDISFKEYLNIDNELETCDTMGNEETVSSIEAEIFDEEIEELQDQQ